MATVTRPDWDLLEPAPYPVRRFTVAEYHTMIDAGVFSDDERFELLEGWIIPKMSKNPPHEVTIALAAHVLTLSINHGWHVRIQSSITLDRSEPEPGLAIVRGAMRDYLGRHPGPGDIALVVEVSDATLWQDRGLKAHIYARAKIPNYWLIDLVHGRVEARADPVGGKAPRYRSMETFGPDGALALAIDGRDIGPIAARDLLP